MIICDDEFISLIKAIVSRVDIFNKGLSVCLTKWWAIRRRFMIILSNDTLFK